jgi:hypothetical protein
MHCVSPSLFVFRIFSFRFFFRSLCARRWARSCRTMISTRRFATRSPRSPIRTRACAMRPSTRVRVCFTVCVCVCVGGMVGMNALCVSYDDDEDSTLLASSLGKQKTNDSGRVSAKNMLCLCSEKCGNRVAHPLDSLRAFAYLIPLSHQSANCRATLRRRFKCRCRR